MSFPESEMHETVSVRAKSGSGAYGPVYGSSVDVACYIEPGFRRVTNAQGAEVVASAMLICPAGSAITTEDEVTYAGRVYEVIDAQTLRPDGIAHHMEVYLKSVAAVVEAES
mgnify:CR=1 FL=1